MSQMPADAPRSEDGQWWWDGTAWQPVDASAHAGAAPSQEGGTPAGTYSGTSEVAAGADIGIGEITLSVSDIAAVLIAANIDIGSGGNDPTAPNTREEYA